MNKLTQLCKLEIEEESDYDSCNINLMSTKLIPIDIFSYIEENTIAMPEIIQSILQKIKNYPKNIQTNIYNVLQHHGFIKAEDVELSSKIDLTSRYLYFNRFGSSCLVSKDLENLNASEIESIAEYGVYAKVNEKSYPEELKKMIQIYRVKQKQIEEIKASKKAAKSLSKIEKAKKLLEENGMQITEK